MYQHASSKIGNGGQIPSGLSRAVFETGHDEAVMGWVRP
jgi:hypothetical protein